MNLQQRKELLIQLGEYLAGNDKAWQEAKQKAFAGNNWFIPEFVEQSAKSIARNYLQEAQLQLLINRYQIPEENPAPKKVGIVMAGNIPLVGFHDLLCVFLTGHISMVKPSSKDEALVKHLIDKLVEWNSEVSDLIVIRGMIPNCDAYIATGSNNSAKYFEYYFQKYPSIIRRNRTSVAILTGKETKEELESLADDVYQYFGLGCRNVTKIYVPKNYDFIPLLEAFRKFDELINHNKYKNNYDHNLAMHILNNKYYMTNGSILLVEDPSPFSPISQLNYEYYSDAGQINEKLLQSDSIQCVVSHQATPFGAAQQPGVCDYADGIDTMEFLNHRLKD